ncbi:MAG: 50S ribosomal protein L18 [Actinobacteria bacterium]|nr:50S ribosomal protein L18 [Actinomycetota bacterium]MBL7123764.1 50S ribosomal protein L18 [Actinomycetota bacterium]
MKTKIERKDKSFRRKSRVRYKIAMNRSLPVLCVYRSNRHIYGQIVDYNTGKTLMGISSKNADIGNNKKGKIDTSFKTGELLAKEAKKKNIDKVVFNRSSYKYHGRVKALAEGARKGGLKF